ncbi:hypothetical protein EST38_g9398 [Candolleomyces aberdarensis]|uniref:Uncharacterized protein n=1 Tax=Candolleomyces aberdarensis TaxID=2316362 RepID=A0A4Q2D9Z9_9AGAR|nr:hypothetical protein EST38_g9398 [Candolleomyces aberdarensis]
MLKFFRANPTIPLRFFITTRIEQHIQDRLEVPEVILDNLDRHGSEHDIEMFVEAEFQREAKRNRVIRAYIQQHGNWPTAYDRHELIDHIQGSFIFGSTLLKYILWNKGDGLTPMDRLPLALEMNPVLCVDCDPIIIGVQLFARPTYSSPIIRDSLFPPDFHRAAQPSSNEGIPQVLAPHPWLPGGNADGEVNNYVADPDSADFQHLCRMYTNVVENVVGLYPNPTGILKRNLIKNLHYWYTGVNVTFGGCTELFPYGQL